MSAELQKQLLDMLKNLLTLATTGADWVAGQIPPLVQERILLGRIEETTWLVIMVLWATLTGYMTYRGVRWAIWMFKDDGENFPAFLLPIFTTVIGLVPLMLTFHAFVLVWFAPRLYIVEWLREMTK